MLTFLLYLSIGLASLTILALLVSPSVGLPILLLGKPIIDTTFYKPLIVGLPLTKIVGALVPLIILAYMAFAKGYRRLSLMPLRGVWLLYAIDVAIFSAFVVYAEGIEDGAEVFLRHINGLVGFYMFQAFCINKKQFRTLLITLIIAGIFPLLTTTYQVITGKQWHHLDFLQLGALTRSSGLYFHIMTTRFYAYQAIIAALLFSVYFVKNQLINWVLSIYGMLAVYVIYHTYSKSGFLTLGIWALSWTVFLRKYRFAIIGVLLSLLVLPFFIEPILTALDVTFYKEVGALGGGYDPEHTLQGRWYLWERLIKDWSKFGLIQQLFGSGHMQLDAHNDYLMMLYHGGIMGVLIYISLLMVTGFKLVRSVWNKTNPLGVAALMLYSGYMIDTAGLVPSTYPHYQWLVWGVIGLYMRLHRETNWGLLMPGYSKVSSDSKSAAQRDKSVGKRLVSQRRSNYEIVER
jgi:hypothetical protein